MLIASSHAGVRCQALPGKSLLLAIGRLLWRGVDWLLLVLDNPLVCIAAAACKCENHCEEDDHREIASHYCQLPCTLVVLRQRSQNESGIQTAYRAVV